MATKQRHQTTLWMASCMLLCVHVDCASKNEQLQHFNDRAQVLRSRLAVHPSDISSHLELAMLLQHVHMLHPDGGQRLPEAEQSYR